MTISDSTEIFFNKRVKEYTPDQPYDGSPNVVYRLALDYDDSRNMSELIEEFLSYADKTNLEALILSMWGDPYEKGAGDIIDTLVKNAAHLPKLRALFIGDMTYEECEISWIVQGNYNALLDAYPNLEALRIRGSTSLELAPFTHNGLRHFVIECGGLPINIAKALAASTMPKLEHLELWLGTDEYGFEGDVELYRGVVSSLRTPALKYLGLRDSQIADELAVWLAQEEWIGQLDTLDLSLGTIGDLGAEALCNGASVRQLKNLLLSHHYISQAWQDKLRQLGIHVALDDPQEEDEYGRYVAVGE